MATRRSIDGAEQITRHVRLEPGETILADVTRNDQRVIVTSAGRKIAVDADGNVFVLTGPQFPTTMPDVPTPTFDASHPPVAHHGGEDADA